MAGGTRAVPRAGPFVAFDLEMSGLLPPLDAWPTDGTAPVYVLCGATARYDADGAAEEVRLWQNDAALVSRTPMLPFDVWRLLDYLWDAHARGDTLVTWGGTASDWRVLEAVCGSAAYAEKCRVMAAHHVDVPFAAASSMGGMMGLRAACLGMGLEAKHPCASAAVPLMWAAGMQALVGAHVTADAAATARVYAAMFDRARDDGADAPSLVWQTAKGAAATWYAPWRADKARVLTVAECMALPKATPKFTAPLAMDRDAIAAWLQPTLAAGHD